MEGARAARGASGRGGGAPGALCHHGRALSAMIGPRSGSPPKTACLTAMHAVPYLNNISKKMPSLLS
eukprot:4388316-Prymnesium_polylepis.1